MTSPKPVAAAPRGALVFVFITVLINMIGFGIVMPVMPKLLMDVTGEDLSAAARWGGYLSLAYAASQFVMMPILGGLSDRFGRRPVILTSLAAFSLDYVILALAQSIGILLAARALSGAFAATFSTANAYIADISSPERRAANFGLIGAAFGLGFTIGPGIGGVLGEEFGPRAPFFAVALLGAANFTFGLLVFPETLPKENRRRFEWRRANAFGNFVQFRKYPIMLPIAATLFVYQIAHWTFPSVWSYYAIEKFAWSEIHIGWSLVFVGLMAALVQGGLVRVVIPRVGERPAALFGVCVAISTYFAFAYASNGLVVYGLIALSALAGFTGPAIQGIMSRTIPANAQGELQGAVSVIMSLSMVIGPPLMTQTFAAFTEPGSTIKVLGMTVSQTGAPVYFPGAPFVLAGVLASISVIPLTVAFGRIQRARNAGEAAAPA